MTPLRARLQMHFCVFVWGFTAILGKVISLTALNLVLWRMALTAVFLYFMTRSLRPLRQFVRADWPQIAITGALIALHWVAFYGSVKVSNASIGVVCMAFAPIFSALLEPWLNKQRISWRDLMLSTSVLPGMVLVVGGIDPSFYWGILLGIIAAGLVAMFSLLSKKLVQKYDVVPLSFAQISSGCVLLLPIALISGQTISIPTSADWPWLLVFAIVCTALPFALSAAALRHMSAFSAQFAVNLEPIYGILFAAWLLNERAQLTTTFYLGAALIVAAVFLQAAISLRSAKKGMADVH
jgi:drug/metabolite transporter (DMT)-like permease